MDKITPEMRELLRAPLPNEAVSPHPTKSYLSTIKSIYVAERINDVFGIGTWTLKGEPVEMLEKDIIMKVVLEIPEYGFYGEAYGGNDNQDRGDAFKGAVTDGFTKIAAQQLEIGIDVFKGIHDTHKPTKLSQPEIKDHWCEEHETAFFKSAKMKSFAHPIGNTGEWCHEHVEKTVVTKTTPSRSPEPEVKPVMPQPKEAQPVAEETSTVTSKPVPEVWPRMVFTDLIEYVKRHGKTEGWLFKTFGFDVTTAKADPYKAALEVKELAGW